MPIALSYTPSNLNIADKTDAAIVELKEADNLSPDDPQIQKVLARQYIAKVDDVADTAW